MSDRITETIKKHRLKTAAPPHRELVIVSSPDPTAVGRRFHLGGQRLVFGRKEKDDRRIDDPSMSRRHFEVRRARMEGHVEVVNDSDTNGTFVNGAAIAAPVLLEDNDVIAAGDTLFVVDREPDADELPVNGSADDGSVERVVGESLGTRRLRRSIATVARTSTPVVLLGETGVGKEVAAQAIHELSGRTGPWVPVNCAAIPDALAESQLFGHERGAFTGAIEPSAGAFERAHGGTLFLDELGEMSASAQAKLLRVVETHVVERLGGTATEIDVRLVAATLRPLEDDPELFRTDLLARLSGWVLRIPPLRARRVDILTLFDRFIRDAQPDSLGRSFELSEALLLHAWPMNVRELANLAKRLVHLSSPGAILDVSLLPASMRSRRGLRASTQPSAESRTVAEREEGSRVLTAPDARISEQAPRRAELEALLREARGNVKTVARANGWHRMQIYRWARRYGIDPARYRDRA